MNTYGVGSVILKNWIVLGNWADKKNSFEVVAGKSVPEDREDRAVW
jgi:hypothetical protein